MKNLGWIGVILWGVFMTGLGLLGVSANAPDSVGTAQEQGVMLLTSAGLITCLVGALGVCGLLSWIPGLRGEQKNY